MGSRDIKKRETKKPKKSGKKAPIIDITVPPQIEIIKAKGKKEKAFPDDEDE